MSTLSIPYLLIDDRLIPLLTDTERARLAENEKEMIKQSKEYDAEDMVQQAVACRIQARQIREDMDRDDRAKVSPKIAVFTWRDPLPEDRKAIRAHLGNIAEAAEEAYNRLDPAISSPDFTEIPYRFRSLVETECLSSVFPNLTEERRLFLT